MCIFKLFKMSNGSVGHGACRIGHLSNKTKTNTGALIFFLQIIIKKKPNIKDYEMF